MDEKFPLIVSAGTIQTTLFSALRVLSVLVGGTTAILGFVGKRDLAGLIAYVQSSDFLAVAGALAALVSFVYGLWITYRRKTDLVTVARQADDSVAVVVEKSSGANTALGVIPLLFLLLAVGSLAACSTVGDVRLNSGKAFLTAQIAFKSTQQTVLVVCSAPARSFTAPCNTAIDLLHKGALAEAAGFTAQQTGNANDLQTAIITLTNLPPQLVALGVLKAN